MNEFAAKKGDEFATHFDIVRRIETMCGEIPYAIKQFKSQVLDFCAMDKRLSAMKSKTEKRASSKKLDRLDAFITEYQAAYRKYTQNYASIAKALDEIASLYSKLSNHYYAAGKRKEAKRAVSDGEKFDKLSRKQLSALCARLDSCAGIALAKEGKATPDAFGEEPLEKSKAGEFREDAREADARQRREEPRRFAQNQDGASYRSYNPQQAPYPPYGNGAPYYPPQYMPPAYYQPMAGLSIAPISIDVNSAVDSIFDSFAKAFDEKMREYIANYELPEIKRPGITEGESEALNKAIEDESFVFEKLSALFEKINSMFESLSELTAKYSELEEKNRALADSIKSATDTERNLARELQGIQATQKVIGVDQLKLAEEQAIIVESQSVAISRQAELRDAENAVSSEIAALLEGANASLDSFKANLAAQNEITNALSEVITANDKLLDLQKNLEERQSELTEIQREALLAQKKLTRSQKAVNERLGAKTNVKKEKSEVEKLTPPEDEAPEIADSAVEAVAEETAETTEASIEESVAASAEASVEEKSEEAIEVKVEEATSAEEIAAENAEASVEEKSEEATEVKTEEVASV